MGSLAMSYKTLIVFALVGMLSLLAQPVIAQDSSSVHEGDWPIQNGFNRQPTPGDRAAGREFSQDQAREIDRLYDQLLSSGDKNQPRLKRAR
jgi:hypothetical protein